MTKRLALIGTCPSWQDAPFKDKSWDIVSWNLTGIKLPRIDVLFEIHRRFVESDTHYLEEQLPEFKPPKQLLSVIPFQQCPANKLLDWDRMKREWGGLWLSSSIAVALAWAIEQEPHEIGLWGIDFESLEEYIVQFAAVRHLMWIAVDRGIKITMPDDCLLKREPQPYPDRFETIQALTYEKMAKRLKMLINRQSGIVETIKARVFMNMGAIQVQEPENEADEAVLRKMNKDLAEDQANLVIATNNLNRLKGELYATQHYRRIFCWNALPPELGAEVDADIDECGPI